MSCCCKKDSPLADLIVFGGFSVGTILATLFWKRVEQKKAEPTVESVVTAATIESFYPFIRERIQVVASKLGVSSDDIYQVLPHLQVGSSISINEPENGLNLAKYIDHTILKANAKQSEVEKLCKEALDNQFAAVCVNASNVALCKSLLQDSQIKIASVVGFPLGATTTETKVFETRQAIDLGAHEIDVVINVGKLLDGDYQYMFNEMKQVADACIEKGAVLKVILECCLLDKNLIADASIICMLAKCHFVKTSTGFSTSGAKLEDCKLMKAICGNVGQVKAAGGIRDKDAAVLFIKESKIARIGTSSGISIINSGQATGY